MRFSAVVALCAAPLALAGSFDLLRAREANLMRRQESVQVQAAKGGNNGASVEVKQSNNGNTQVTEIIIIWVNQGGNAATSTVNSAMTQTGGAAVSGATHTVSTSIFSSTRNANICTGRCRRCRRSCL